jgi:hypothetical protein
MVMRLLFSNFIRTSLALLLLGSVAAVAQTDSLPPPPPTPPLDIRDPLQLMPPQAQPRQRLPLDQLRRMPAQNNGELTATASFEPSVLRLMRFGEYRVTIIGAPSGVDIPEPLPAPDGLFLELTGKTPGVAVVNGQRVPTLTFIYTATASHAGKYVMPSFSATVAGKAVTVPASQVTVQEPGPADLPYQAVNAVLDLRPGEYYVGQSIPTRLLVFDTPDESVQVIANVTKPSGDFLFQSQSGARKDRVPWEGKVRSALVTSLRLTPIKPGESDVTVQAIVFVAKLNAIGRSSGNTAQAVLDTPPVRLTVRPLPESGKKPGFTGAIGKFSLGRTQLSAKEAIVGDPVTYTVVLSGEGNLEAIGAPSIDGGDMWQTFTPTTDVGRDPATGEGTKTITYTLIPRSADVRAVPAIPFSYFDPETGQYVDLSVPPTPIVVKPSAPTEAHENAVAPGATPAPAADAAPVVKKAEPILTGLAERPGASRRSPSPTWSGMGFWLAQGVPALGLLGLWFWRWRTDYLAAHPEIVRRRVARAAARGHLRRARSAAAERNAQGFVTASIDAIRAATSPLDTASAESLVMAEVLGHSPEAHANATVQRLFERAHAERFSGHGVETNGVFELLPEVERTVAAIERRQP